MIFWTVPLLFGASFAGLAYVILQALNSGAEAYAGFQVFTTI